jgi:hypothetical protein
MRNPANVNKTTAAGSGSAVPVNKRNGKINVTTGAAPK